MNKISRYELGAKLGEIKKNNQLFTIFFKKKDGSDRRLYGQFRRQMDKRLKGGTWSNSDAKPEDYQIFNVIDLEIDKKLGDNQKSKAWRSVKINSVYRIKTGGQTFEVED